MKHIKSFRSHQLNESMNTVFKPGKEEWGMYEETPEDIRQKVCQLLDTVFVEFEANISKPEANASKLAKELIENVKAIAKKYEDYGVDDDIDEKSFFHFYFIITKYVPYIDADSLYDMYW